MGRTVAVYEPGDRQKETQIASKELPPLTPHHGWNGPPVLSLEHDKGPQKPNAAARVSVVLVLLTGLS